MARGRAASKNHRKSKSKRSETITDEQWEKMKSFGTFVVNDSDSGEPQYKFKRGDIAAILPDGRDPGDQLDLSQYWIGTIRDIRAEVDDEGSNAVWARVQWYYSGKDVGDVIKSFDQSTVGRYERIYADHQDFVGSESFDAVIPMIKFNEKDHEQAFIPRDQFFRRYTFEYKARTLKPKPGSSSCICLKPYNPNDMELSSLMHFCPRPSCRRAYHQSCLLKAKSKESSSTTTPAPAPSTSTHKPVRKTRSARKHASPVKKPSTRTKKMEPDPQSEAEASANRALRLLACSPDTDETVDLESLLPLTVVHVMPRGKVEDDDDDEIVVVQPPKKKRRGGGHPSKGQKSGSGGSTSQFQTQEPRTLSSVLDEIPATLLEIAKQPMVRGGVFIVGGVSGNIGFVTRARRLVYAILEGTRDLGSLDQWEDEVFGDDGKVGEEGGSVSVENAIVKLFGSRKALPPFVCPNCKSAI